MPVTKQQIADKLGISRTAVSLALNNSPKCTLSEKTRSKIFDTAREMGYPLNQVQSAHKRICLAMFNMDGKVAQEANSGMVTLIDDYLSTLGYSLIYLNVKKTPQSEKRLIKYLESGEASGLVMVAPTEEDILPSVRKTGVPYVIFSEMPSDVENSFCYDTYYFSRAMVGRLLELGHKSIAFFSASLRFPQQKNLLRGYREVLEESGIGYNPMLVQSSSLEDGSELAERMSILGIPYTAAICSNPVIQFGALSWLRSHGKQVPGDISLLGYGSPSGIVEHSIPKLSVCYGEQNEVIEAGMRQLLGGIDRKPAFAPCVRSRNLIFYDGQTITASPDRA